MAGELSQACAAEVQHRNDVIYMHVRDMLCNPTRARACCCGACLQAGADSAELDRGLVRIEPECVSHRKLIDCAHQMQCIKGRPADSRGSQRRYGPAAGELPAISAGGVAVEVGAPRGVQPGGLGGAGGHARGAGQRPGGAAGAWRCFLQPCTC
jgi:hypothetical protein